MRITIAGMPQRMSTARPQAEGTAPKLEAILLDEGWAPTLYAAAGLRKAGCAVHVVTAANGEHLDAKYLGRKITREIVPPVGSAGYIPAVEAVLAGRPSATVLAFTENVLYRLWDANPRWLTRVYPEFHAWQRELLRDKARLSEYAAQAGIGTPRQRSISSPTDVSAAIEALGLPVVVKGGVGFGGATVRIVHSEREAFQAVEEITKKGSCFLQQYIAGPTFLVGGLFHGGQPLRLYAGEKIECAHATGPSLRLRSDDDAALIASALKVFRALGWNGLASVDMMRGQDGAYYFIEFNPRPWGSIAASAETGVDMFGPLARLLAGDIPAPDLSFAKGVESTLFPQVAQARLRAGGVRSLTCIAREPRIWLGAPWRDPGLALHLARYIWWSWRAGQLGRPKLGREKTASIPTLDEMSVAEQESIENG